MINDELLALIGGSAERWIDSPIEDFLPPASRIFLQTHLMPMLMRHGQVREIYLHLRDCSNQKIPVIMNCQKGSFAGADSYYWVFFVAQERSRFEVELLSARKRAEDSARELAESQRFISTIADAMPSLVAYWDNNLICRFANKPYLEWFGRPAHSIVGGTMLDLLGERLFALNKPYIDGVLAGAVQQFERTLTKADGSTGYTWAHYIPDLDSQGNIAGFYVLVSDITQIKIAESELILAASVFKNTIEGIMVTDASGIILSVNPAFTEITGYRAEEAIGHTPRILKSNHHDQAFFRGVWRDILDNGRWEGETWNRRKNGDVFLVWQTITTIRSSAADEPVRYVSVFNDITERWRNDERLRYLAFHDPLTDLPNRSLLMERLNQLLAMTLRERRKIAVLFIDLDGFKFVNDTYGHDVGDDLLKSIAQKLSAELRSSDTIARLGGDEFVILLDNPENDIEIGRIADRVIATINEPLTLRGNVAQVSGSIGIAVHPADGQTALDLMKAADIAMYTVKAEGKNNCRFFSSLQDIRAIKTRS